MSGHIPEGATTPPKTFTPGPWRISNLDARVIGPVRILRDKDSATEIQQILAVARVTERLQETEPNARLIAAAPELLEACRAMTEWFDALKEKQNTLLVEGQSFASAAKNWDTATLDTGFDLSLMRAAIAKAEGREP